MAEASNNLSGEIWKPVSGWEDRYEVSNYGRVRSLPFTLELMTRWGNTTVRHTQEKLLSIQRGRTGYQMVHLKRDGKRVAKYVHRLVCEAFHGPAPEGRQVAHGDANRSNNRADNLRWATAAENSEDRIRHGNSMRGDSSPCRKLSEAAVREIRTVNNPAWDRGFAKRFGVKPRTISDARLRRSWRWMG